LFPAIKWGEKIPRTSKI